MFHARLPIVGGLSKLVLLLGVLLVAAASCTGSSSSGSDTGAGTPAESVSPLEELIGVPMLDPDAMNDWFEGREVERHVLIAECMLGEGFEYSHEAPLSLALDTDLSRSSREYAEEFGFGIVAGVTAMTYDASKDYSTKNTRYVASLSDTEAQAYNQALHGDLGRAEGSSPIALPEDGCNGEASQQAFEALSNFTQVLPQAQDMIEQVMADSRMIVLTEQWTECMATAGFPQDDPLDPRSPFYERITAILMSGNALEFSPGDVPPEVDEAIPPILGAPGSGFGVLPPFNEAGQQKIDALLTEEVGTAVADFDCRAEIEEEAEIIGLEYEQKLVPIIEEAMDG